MNADIDRDVVTMVCADCGAQQPLAENATAGVVNAVQLFVAEHSTCAKSIELVIQLPGVVQEH